MAPARIASTWGENNSMESSRYGSIERYLPHCWQRTQGLRISCMNKSWRVGHFGGIRPVLPHLHQVWQAKLLCACHLTRAEGDMLINSPIEFARLGRRYQGLAIGTCFEKLVCTLRATSGSPAEATGRDKLQGSPLSKCEDRRLRHFRSLRHLCSGCINRRSKQRFSNVLYTSKKQPRTSGSQTPWSTQRNRNDASEVGWSLFESSNNLVYNVVLTS